MLSYVPLHLDCLPRSLPLKKWLSNLTRDIHPKFLAPEDWFLPQRGDFTWIWTPPPAAADAMVERLRVSRHLRPNSLHIVLIPRLMTGRWRKNMGKASDCYCKLDAAEIWPLETQLEPLLMFLCFPCLPHRPRFHERESLVERFGRCMLPGPLPALPDSIGWNLLCELLGEAKQISTM